MRLPEFFVNLSPIKETLAAIDSETAVLEEETALRNARLAVSTADETGLALWEADFGLSPVGDLSARRSRVRAALTGDGQMMTLAALRQLASTVGGAGAVSVEEDFANGRVVIKAVFPDPAGAAALEEALERFKPAHLQVQVNPTVELRGGLTLYPVLSGGLFVTLTGKAET